MRHPRERIDAAIAAIRSVGEPCEREHGEVLADEVEALLLVVAGFETEWPDFNGVGR